MIKMLEEMNIVFRRYSSLYRKIQEIALTHLAFKLLFFLSLKLISGDFPSALFIAKLCLSITLDHHDPKMISKLLFHWR